MKEKLLLALKSRTVWSIALLFIISGTEAVKEQLNPELRTAAEAFLALAAVYFRVNPQAK